MEKFFESKNYNYFSIINNSIIKQIFIILEYLKIF